MQYLTYSGNTLLNASLPANASVFFPAAGLARHRDRRHSGRGAACLRATARHEAVAGPGRRRIARPRAFRRQLPAVPADAEARHSRDLPGRAARDADVLRGARTGHPAHVRRRHPSQDEAGGNALHGRRPHLPRLLARATARISTPRIPTTSSSPAPPIAANRSRPAARCSRAISSSTSTRSRYRSMAATSRSRWDCPPTTACACTTRRR